MRARVNGVIAGIAFGLSACATMPAVPHVDYDFSKIKRVMIMPFEGAGGTAATDEFVKEIAGTGMAVSDPKHSGDAILRGTVTEYKTNTPVMVFLGNTTLIGSNGQAVTVDNPAVSTQGFQGTPEGISPGAHQSQVVSMMATVSMDVVLLDASTKTPLWRGSQSYEGLDLSGALETAVGRLTRSLARVLPRMRQKPS